MPVDSPVAVPKCEFWNRNRAPDEKGWQLGVLPTGEESPMGIHRPRPSSEGHGRVRLHPNCIVDC
jgi:hypothetical protein